MPLRDRPTILSGADKLRFTLDTNILVYAFGQPGEPRHETALDIVNRALDVDCCFMLQALSEFYSVTTRKRMLSRADAAGQVTDWLVTFPCAAASGDAVRVALAAAVAGRASYWDALLIATAAEAGCALILTEDLADGVALNGVEIHNPFAPSGGLTEKARELLRV